MSHRRVALFSLVLYGALACAQGAFSPRAEAASPDETSAENSAPKDASIGRDGGQISCKQDSDCPALACGPCAPGTPITKKILEGPQCAVNPCMNATAVCNAQHFCVVGPGTAKNPSVWKRPPP